MSEVQRTIVHQGQFFRVEHQPIDGRELPYEFVRRIGATTVLPIVSGPGLYAEPYVVSIHNTRAFYGASFGLPGGNANGGFDRPEHPTLTGLRETREETGYGYPQNKEPNVDSFLLRDVSNTILYDRSFLVARGLEYMGGELHSAHEVVEPRLVPLEDYLQPLFAMQGGHLYPEINLAIAKAGLEIGREETTDWLVLGEQSPYAADVIASFEPWMRAVV